MSARVIQEHRLNFISKDESFIFYGGVVIFLFSIVTKTYKKIIIITIYCRYAFDA